MEKFVSFSKYQALEFPVKQGKQGLGILLPGRSYGNQDCILFSSCRKRILLPGRSYGNQDNKIPYKDDVIILLPGRSYGNQDMQQA